MSATESFLDIGLIIGFGVVTIALLKLHNWIKDKAENARPDITPAKQIQEASP
jgi:hypothetical protein